MADAVLSSVFANSDRKKPCATLQCPRNPSGNRIWRHPAGEVRRRQSVDAETGPAFPLVHLAAALCDRFELLYVRAGARCGDIHLSGVLR